jgi:hypothetical protein
MDNRPIIETKNYRKSKMPKKKKIAIAVSASVAVLCVGFAGFWFLHPHKFAEWQIVKAPTCTEAGEEFHECFCGESETKTIEALGHTEEMLRN